MMHVKRLVGEKIFLSPIIEEDYLKFYEWMNDDSIIDNIGRSDKLTTYEVNKIWCESSSKDSKQIFSIVEYDDKLIGCCGINDINYLHRTCELYIYIGEKNMRGKGVGKEAIQLLLDYAFNTLNMNSIFIKAFSYNTKAINLYKKVGFQKIGMRRKSHYLNNDYHDIILFDLLKSEYQGVQK